MSERRACRALSQPRSTQRYGPKRADMDRRLLEEMRRAVELLLHTLQHADHFIESSIAKRIRQVPTVMVCTCANTSRTTTS